MTGLLLGLALGLPPVKVAVPAATPVPAAERVMKLIATGQTDEAGAEMRRQHLWGGRVDVTGLFKTYTDLLNHPGSELGPPLGAAELVRTEPAGPSFTRAVFVVKFERHATVWKLTYYRPRGEWRLHNIFFDIHPQAVERLFLQQ